MPLGRLNSPNESLGEMPEDISDEVMDNPEIPPEDEGVSELEDTESPESEGAKSVEEKMLEEVLLKRGGTPSDWKRGENWREDYFNGRELYKADRQTSITKELEDTAEQAGTTEWLEDHRLFLQHLADRPGEVFIFPDFIDQDGTTHVYVALSDGERVIYGEFECLVQVEEIDKEADAEGGSLEEGKEILSQELVETLEEQVEVVEEDTPVQVETAEAVVGEDKSEEEGVVVLSKEAPQVLRSEVTHHRVRAEVSIETSPVAAVENELSLEIEEIEDQEVLIEVEPQQDAVSETETEEVATDPVSAEIPTVFSTGIRLVEGPSIDSVSKPVTKERGEAPQEVLSETVAPVTQEAEGPVLEEELIDVVAPEEQSVEVEAVQSESIEVQQTGPLIQEEVQQTVGETSQIVSETKTEEGAVLEAANDNETVVESISEKEDTDVEDNAVEAKDSLTEALKELFTDIENSENVPQEEAQRRTVERVLERPEISEQIEVVTERSAPSGLSPELAFMMGFRPNRSSRPLGTLAANDNATDPRESVGRSRNGITLMAA